MHATTRLQLTAGRAAGCAFADKVWRAAPAARANCDDIAVLQTSAGHLYVRLYRLGLLLEPSSVPIGIHG